MSKPAKTFNRKLSTPIKGVPLEVIEWTGLALALADFIGEPANPEHLALYEKHLARIAEQKQHRYDLLFEHFNTSKGDWEGLARSLAESYVPGLQVMKDRAGAKTKWDPMTVARLRVQLEEIQAEKPGRTLADAARIAAKRPAWRWAAPGKSGWETLRRKAYQADPRFVAIMRRIKVTQEEVPVDQDMPGTSAAEHIRRYYESQRQSPRPRVETIAGEFPHMRELTRD